MASFTDILPQFNPYIQQLPVDAMVQVGMEKQRRYDEGVQKIQTQIDNIAGMDVIRDVDKAYLQSKYSIASSNNSSRSSCISAIVAPFCYYYRHGYYQLRGSVWLYHIRSRYSTSAIDCGLLSSMNFCNEYGWLKYSCTRVQSSLTIDETIQLFSLFNNIFKAIHFWHKFFVLLLYGDTIF